jgi:hypothetical protein
MGEKRNAYRLLVGKPEEKRPRGRPRCRWLHTIRTDLIEVGWGDVDCIGLPQDRETLGNCRVSKQVGISRVVLISMELVNIIPIK